jgi:hypothetical protein
MTKTGGPSVGDFLREWVTKLSVTPRYPLSTALPEESLWPSPSFSSNPFRMLAQPETHPEQVPLLIAYNGIRAEDEWGLL